LKLKELLPLSGVPRSGGPEGCVVQWCGQDSLENYRKNGGHPLYGENDVAYSYNSRGYRCPEFDAEAQVRMVSIGCSFALGVGVPQSAAFHELFAERLRQELGSTVVNWNLSTSGASNDYIARVLQLTTSELDPDVVLILFTRLARREYVAATDRSVHYNPSWQSPDPVIREVCGHFAALTSSFDDELNFFRNYKSIERLLADRLWLFSFLDSSQLNVVASHLDVSHRCSDFRWLDKARDHGHAGPRTHDLLYTGFWTKFVETGGLEKLRSKIGPRQP
jgi:hypothetical protein